MFYRSTKNTRLAEQVAATFAAALKDLHKPIYQMTPEFLSALFLLSSDNKLWNRAKNSYTMNRIDFDKINVRGIDPDGCCALKLNMKGDIEL